MEKSRTIDMYVLLIHRLYRHIHIWKRQSYLLLSDRQQYRAFRQRVINGLRNSVWMWMSKSVTFESEITVSSGMADKQWVGRPVGRSALTTSSQILDQCFWSVISRFILKLSSWSWPAWLFPPHQSQIILVSSALLPVCLQLHLIPSFVKCLFKSGFVSFRPRVSCLCSGPHGFLVCPQFSIYLLFFPLDFPLPVIGFDIAHQLSKACFLFSTCNVCIWIFLELWQEHISKQCVGNP